MDPRADGALGQGGEGQQHQAGLMTARLCIVRHGETQWNAEGRVQGQLDVPLSDVGLKQARCVADALPARRFTSLYSSDLCRVRQTAEPSVAKLGLAPHVDPCLR